MKQCMHWAMVSCRRVPRRTVSVDPSCIMITKDQIAKGWMDESWSAEGPTDGWTGGRADGPRSTGTQADGQTNDLFEKHFGPWRTTGHESVV